MHQAGHSKLRPKIDASTARRIGQTISVSNSYPVWLVLWNMDFIFPYIGNFIILTDFHMFQSWNHQAAVNSPCEGLSHVSCISRTRVIFLGSSKMGPLKNTLFDSWTSHYWWWIYILTVVAYTILYNLISIALLLFNFCGHYFSPASHCGTTGCFVPLIPDSLPHSSLRYYTSVPAFWRGWASGKCVPLLAPWSSFFRDSEGEGRQIVFTAIHCQISKNIINLPPFLV